MAPFLYITAMLYGLANRKDLGVAASDDLQPQVIAPSRANRRGKGAKIHAIHGENVLPLPARIVLHEEGYPRAGRERHPHIHTGNVLFIG